MRAALVTLALLVAGCRSELSDTDLVELSAKAAALPRVQRSQHRGPAVAPGTSGTGRFAPLVWREFSADGALVVTTFADGFYRAPANEGFDATLDEVERRLRAAGYGTREELALEVFEEPREAPAWTPRRARLALLRGGEERVLHAFEAPADRDRTLLPENAPSAALEARLVARPEDAAPGTAVLLDAGLSGGALQSAAQKGAVLAIASDLEGYNVDRSAKQRHLDAIGFRTVSAPCPLAVAQVSPRTMAALREAAADPGARVRFEAQVELARRPLRTLVATVVGARAPLEAVPVVAHVQEPGACDNASGVGTTAECARVAAKLVTKGVLKRPARSLAFVFGAEMEQSRVWLERSGRTPVAAIAADMTGENAELTGALALLERAPDPGALRPLPPDAHTAWGAGAVQAADLRPTGVALVLRCALADTGALAGGWNTAEHPFEGGSDHVVFLGRGVPAALVWHFPDWAYHTSADRLEHVDAQEMRRTGTALLAGALALADAQPGDLDRWLHSVQLEIELRVRAAEEAKDAQLAARWKAWGDGVRQWLRELCLGKAAALPAKAGEAAGGKR
jgi:hypothetical protein